MKTVITYGTFDLFHIGHVNILRRARSLGDRLIVGVSTDGFNELKGKRSFIPFEDRCAVLSACRYVDEVFAEENWDQKATDVIRYKADIFVIGNDWAGKFDELAQYCEVHYLARTDGISSSIIRKSLGDGAKRLPGL